MLLAAWRMLYTLNSNIYLIYNMLACELDSWEAHLRLARRHDFQVLAELEVGILKQLSLWNVYNRLAEVSTADALWNNRGQR